MNYVLYARRGWGSAISEAALTRAGMGFDLAGVSGDRSRAVVPLRKANPLGQVPTLVCPDGMILTESAAILQHIDDVVPDAGLVPAPGVPERRLYLRCLQMLMGAIYPTFTYADYPARYVSGKRACTELVHSIHERRKTIWTQIEGMIEPDPWFLGSRFSGLDLYIAVMTRWGPRRRWFSRHCPRLYSVARHADADALLSPVWARNYASRPVT